MTKLSIILQHKGRASTVASPLFSLVKLGALLALACTVYRAQAQTTDKFDEDFDNKNKHWVEIALKLPSPPKTADLLPFYVGPTATQTSALDVKSLSVGADGVVRYTIVTTSPSGVKNISFEGIRCASFEFKLYAIGHQNGSWARSRNDQWRPISQTAANRQQAALAQDFFCQGKVVTGKPGEILRAMRGQAPSGWIIQ
jgi:hypothetical protein